ncbi:MAG: DUF1800 family protein [Cyclobacteriaceae bacterium]|nr:DUF1800 family protein [Cyclobacteriaceae bacterium HetDA_MAG_MS6]
MAIEPLTGTLGKKRAAHLLRRACFGATKEQIDEFSALTADEAVDRLFSTTIPDPPLPLDPATGEEWVISGTTGASSEDDDLQRYFLRWWLGQFLSAGIAPEDSLPYAFRERVVLFLHTHFTTKRSTVRNSRSLYFQNALFRFYAFDTDDIIIPPDEINPEENPGRTIPLNFKQLVNKISIDNAMLRFLDGRLNVKGSPNENYGRELLELYSVGRGLEGTLPDAQFDGDYVHFTEQDVQAAARVLSGFDTDLTFGNIDEDTGLPTGVVKGGNVASAHDNDEKVFSFRFNDQVISGDPELMLGSNPTPESTLDEVRQLVDMIFDQDETARHICREIYRFFVYHEIPSTLHEGFIQDLASVFELNDFKLAPILRVLLTSQHFYDADGGVNDNKFGGLIKSPIDLLVGFVRAFDIQLPDYATETETFYEWMGDYLREIDLMGMDLYEPFEVAGYAAYHQYPIYNRSWISTNYLTNRYNFIKNRLSVGAGSVGNIADVLSFVQDQFDVATIRNAKQLITELISYFFPVADDLDFNNPTGEITPERLNFFYQEFLLQEGLGDVGEEAWDQLWDGANFNADIASERLSFLFNALLQTPEYQLM